MRSGHWLTPFVTCLFLLNGCGGGSGGKTGGTSTQAPSNLTYPQTMIAEMVGTVMSPDVPTASGGTANYSISPALPAGLALSAMTGAITGTPTAVSPQATYAVTAFNSGGATTAVLTIAVVAAPPAPPSNLVYPQTSITAAAGKPITPDTPTLNSTEIAFSVSPALPAGLALNQTTGTISGVPAATSPQTTYTITATNPTGSTTATVTITVILTAPSNLSYPQSTIVLIAGRYLAFDTPTLIGIATNFSISPALPGGIYCDATSGVIYGLTGNLSPETTYTVTASNSVGSTTTTVTITVFPPAPVSIAYPKSTISATATIAMPADIPAVSGIIESFSSNPALPAGLTLDQTTGAISGAPVAGSAKTNYTISAFNVSGSVQTTVTIAVAAAPKLLYDLGNAIPIALAGSPNYVVLVDSAGILVFDAHTGAQVWNLPAGPDISLSRDGSTLALSALETAPPGNYGPIEIYSIPSMNLMSTLPAGDITFSLTGSGSSILQQLTTTNWELTDLTGSTVLWSATTFGPVTASPDGTFVATNSSPGGQDGFGATIYHNGLVVANVPAVADSWIDNTRLLGAVYGNYDAKFQFFSYITSAIYSSSGQTLLTLPTGTIPEILHPQFTGADSVYYPPNGNFPSNANAIYSLADGSVLWQGPIDVLYGALAGSNVAYIHDSRVLLESY